MNESPDVGEPRIGLARAIVSGIGLVVVALAAAVYGSNAVVTKMTGLSRDTREYLASLVFLVVLFVAAWALRRLQARGLI